MINLIQKNIFVLAVLVMFTSIYGCKHKNKMQKQKDQVVAVDVDTLGKCRLDFKNSKALTRYIRENEVKYNWLFLKSNVTTMFEGEDKSFDAKVRLRKDSLMLITIELLSIDFAKVLIFDKLCGLQAKWIFFPTQKRHHQNEFRFQNRITFQLSDPMTVGPLLGYQTISSLFNGSLYF